MQTLLMCGLGVGAIAGVAHAYGLVRARRRRTPTVAGNLFESAGYVAVWTIGLWMLFGTYVLSLWVLATMVYVGGRAHQLLTRAR